MNESEQFRMIGETPVYITKSLIKVHEEPPELICFCGKPINEFVEERINEHMKAYKYAMDKKFEAFKNEMLNNNDSKNDE